MDLRLRSRLRCPVCYHESLDFNGQSLRCPQCGTQFGSLRGIPDFVGEREQSVGPAQTLMETSLYARWYEFFRPALTRLISPRPLREEFALSTRLLSLEDDSELLDVGCGNGNFTRKFARHLRALNPNHNGFVLGLDLSRSMLLEALEAEPADPDVHYLRADAASIPLRDNTFDRLHCAGSLHLMNEVRDTLKNFARVLRPEGLLVIGTFLLGDGVVRPLAKRIGGWFSRFHWFTRRELTDLLDETGFTMEEASVAGDAITLRARRRSD
jgi:ubiquinone/menaquinone biosynthesis C-methylase UbiE